MNPIVALLLLLLVSWLAFAIAVTVAVQLGKRLNEERSRRQSQSTRYGQMTEQFMPFLDDYPWDPQHFRFLGSPIDGVQFEDDKVILVEFKTGNSQLSRNQRRIRDQVSEGQVEFEVIRVR
jgi:predicted Holliday junction resolvase-like endonuclease